MDCLFIIDSLDSVSGDGTESPMHYKKKKPPKKSDFVNFEFIESWLALLGNEPFAPP